MRRQDMKPQKDCRNSDSWLRFWGVWLFWGWESGLGAGGILGLRHLALGDMKSRGVGRGGWKRWVGDVWLDGWIVVVGHEDS